LAGEGGTRGSIGSDAAQSATAAPGRSNPEVRSALTGHSAQRDESANYGAGMGSFIQLLAESIGKIRPLLPPVTTKAAA
jgi:hypothetical protein